MNTAIFHQTVIEESVIDKAIDGDLDAFNQLVEAYQDIAFHHAWTFLKDIHLAEDVTQDSFIKAYQSIEKFRKGSFRAWLLRIVTNTSYDLLRRNKRQKFLPLIPQRADGSEISTPKWLVDLSPSIEETLENKEMRMEIYRLMDELPKIYREVLTLIDIYDFKYKEAAQTLNIKVGTVKSRLARARLQMKRKLKHSPSFQGPANSTGITQLIPTNKPNFETNNQFQLNCTKTSSMPLGVTSG